MILHVVFYQPKRTATEADLGKLVAAIEAVSRGIPTIRQVRVGRTTDLKMTYSARSETLNMDYVAIFEFIDTNGLKDYLAHPSHAVLSDRFWNLCERTLIVDFTAVDPVTSDLKEFFGQIG